MTKFHKKIRADNLDYVSDSLKDMGYKVRAFPLREHGLNQSNYRNLEILNSGSEADKMRRARKLREFNIDKY